MPPTATSPAPRREMRRATQAPNGPNPTASTQMMTIPM